MKIWLYKAALKEKVLFIMITTKRKDGSNYDGQKIYVLLGK